MIRLAPCISRSIYEKMLLITKWFREVVAYILFFAHIPDRINHLRVGRINFDICYIGYYALYVSVSSYYKETFTKSNCILTSICV